MFLATDIGNSNIVIAIHNGQEWIHIFRYETKDYQPALFYETGIRDILLEWGVAPADITGAAVSSVVPEVTERIMQAITNSVRFVPILLNPELFIKLDMRIPKVYEIGSDIVANAVAVRKLYQQNCIVVDFGTALTFTIYEHTVGITGVTIAPGLKTIISTLSDSTSLLPEIDIDMPESAIGTSTSTAIKAGVLFGFIGMVKEILSRIKSELDESYKIVATGGLSAIIKELNSEYDETNKNLTLDGIRILAQNDIK
ncbi:MAG: type III pantothenate kinase [Saprospiraceae bacterium]|jgi:type III pantothenate kinase